MKEILQSAVLRVLPNPPNWSPHSLAKALEIALQVFREMYHKTPQPGIDGQSPAERSMDFDPLRAAEMRVHWFDRALDAEPGRVVAEELHDLFQLPNEKQQTIKTLGRFSGSTLRELMRKVKPYIGPPFPEWMYDPLGYLAAKARKISVRRRKEYLRKLHREEERKADRRRVDEQAHERERIEHERQERPERFIDEMLNSLTMAVVKKIPGLVRIMTRQLDALLQALAPKLGRAFKSELERLRSLVDGFTEFASVRKEVKRILTDLALNATQ